MTKTKELNIKNNNLLIDKLWIPLESVIFVKGNNKFTDSINSVKLNLLKINCLNSDTAQIKYKVNYGS